MMVGFKRGVTCPDEDFAALAAVRAIPAVGFEGGLKGWVATV
jgi:hypothetical protein